MAKEYNSYWEGMELMKELNYKEAGKVLEILEYSMTEVN